MLSFFLKKSAGSMSWLFLSIGCTQSLALVTVVNCLTSLSIAFSDVVIDSVVVERVRG